MSDDPLEGFCIQPEPTEQDRAAAIICGSNQVLAMGDEMVPFHGFVQEVLADTVGKEIAHLERENARLRAEVKVLKSQDWDALKAYQLHIDSLPLAKRPVAFRVKDYADGWIIFQDERAAYDQVEKTGAAMQGLYVRDGNQQSTAGEKP